MARRRIQIWTGSIGGHMQAACSLAQALKKSRDEIEVVYIDTLAVGLLRQPFSRTANSYDAFVANAPALWGRLFHFTNTSFALRLTRHVVSHATRRESLQRIVIEGTPDLIVRVIVDLGQLRLLHELTDSPPPLITVVTDPVTVHRAWLTPSSGLYIVPTTEARAACIRYGIPEKAIQLVGFPIRSELFCSTQRPANASLTRDHLRILVMGGSSGSGRICEDVKLLISSGLTLDITVVCGKNAQLYKRLVSLAQESPNSPRLSVLRYTDQIPQLMKDSDVLVTKAGPTTLYEAIASQLPAIINSHIPGQEQGNARYFADMGVALISNSPEETLELVRRFLRDPGILDCMRNPELAFQVCQASPRIAQVILEAVQVDEWSAVHWAP